MGKRLYKKSSWMKYVDGIYDELVKRNRYSKYIDFSGFKGEDSAVLQSIILGDVGDTISDFVGMDVDQVIEMFECFFESTFERIPPKPPKKKEKIIWTWKGMPARKLGLTKIFSPHEIGKAVAILANNNYLIERRMKANTFRYLCNGYRFEMKNNYT